MFLAAAAVCIWRNRDAASRTAFHSIIPKQFFSSTLILANGALRACPPFIVEELMENGHRRSATWSTNSDPPHRSREGCHFSLTECQELPRDVFPQELAQLNGPNFLGVHVLPVIRDAVFWDVSGDFLRFRQRANPLVVVELLRGRASPSSGKSIVY